MYRRYPAAPRWGHSVAQSSQGPQRSLHSSHQDSGLHQLQDASTSATPASSYGPLWPFFEMHRANGELDRLRTRNDVLWSVIHALGSQPSSGCGCHSPGPCQCHQHHHHQKE